MKGFLSLHFAVADSAIRPHFQFGGKRESARRARPGARSPVEENNPDRNSVPELLLRRQSARTVQGQGLRQSPPASRPAALGRHYSPDRTDRHSLPLAVGQSAFRHFE